MDHRHEAHINDLSRTLNKLYVYLSSKTEKTEEELNLIKEILEVLTN